MVIDVCLLRVPSAPPRTFELTLAVPDLEPAVAFYRQLFGAGPTGQENGVAWFLPAHPLVRLTLHRGEGDPSAELGFCLGAGELARTRARLRRAGVALAQWGLAGSTLPREIGLTDPAGHRWRLCTPLAGLRVPRVSLAAGYARRGGTALRTVAGWLLSSSEVEARLERERARAEAARRRQGVTGWTR